eukprot:TRINITY_DN34163_c0_g1_i1.p2 TRINITY_DN34163_c0_g1~~TRINITY_DN34163_c0_g1_i1.p2  ORF type:complete len:187 (+),score=50.05 TRINITY_DN34163_c0_g1_i1:81-641(+)
MAAGAAYVFPAFYNMPPFFTLQPHAAVRAKQLALWKQVVTGYCAHNRVYILDISDAGAASSDLFHHKAIQRQLTGEALRAVAEHLVAEGVAIWPDGVATGTRLLVLWKSASEWADLVLRWAEQMGHIGSVETVLSLSEGDGTEGEAFHGAPVELIMVALEELAKRGRATIFRGAQTASQGVKFLPA